MLRGRGISWLLGFFVFWFLGFLFFWFLGFRFLGFLVSEFCWVSCWLGSWFRSFLVSWFQMKGSKILIKSLGRSWCHITRFPFHIFWKVFIPYPIFQDFIKRMLNESSGFSSAHLLHNFHLCEIQHFETRMLYIFQKPLMSFLIVLRYPCV